MLACCLAYSMLGSVVTSGGVAGFLENALVRTAPGELQGAALEAILEVAASAPADFAGGYRSKLSWLQGYLSHVNAVGEPRFCFRTEQQALICHCTFKTVGRQHYCNANACWDCTSTLNKVMIIALWLTSASDMQ